MSKRKIPLALFAYNRPGHTERTLDALLLCRRRDDFDFYFFSDGPRTADARSDVAKVRLILKSYAEMFSAEIIEQPTNLGLAKSIVGGVSRLCESHGRVVVLEDDLVVSPDFLHFMASALDYYEDSPGVMQVGAYTIAPPENLEFDAFLLPVTTTWGWGTWARAWNSFSWTPAGWPGTRTDLAWLSLFQIGGTGKFVSMLESRLAGRNDSWGILWWYAVSRCAGQVVYPRQSLVWNGGFDKSGVHCGIGSLGQVDEVKPGPALQDVLSFPRETRHVPEHYALLKDVLRKQSTISAYIKSRWRYVINQLRKGARHAFG